MGASRAITPDRGPVYSWSPSPGTSPLSLPEQIAEAIGSSIVRGELDPGERIHEQDIAERFSVSRGPAREALRILERDGLVQIHARRGARVTELTVDEVEEVFEMRSVLLALAVRRIAQRPDPALRAEIRRRVDRLRDLCRDDDPEGYVRSANELNLMLAGTCGSVLLRNTYHALAHRTLRYTRLGLATSARRAQSARKWRQLCVAVEADDADRAGLLAESLVNDSKAMAVALLRDAVAPSTIPGVSEREEGADREPRRNRLPHHPKLPRAGVDGGRRSLRA